jgi:hypothetical protein
MQAHVIIYFVPGSWFLKSEIVTGFATVSTTGSSSLSFTTAVTTSADTPLLSWTIVECLSTLPSATFAKLLAAELDVLFASCVFRKRQTTAQSSILEVGYLVRQARLADSTRKRAAEAREVALLMMLTTSVFERTSHTYNKKQVTVDDLVAQNPTKKF